MSNSANPWTVAHQAPLPIGFSRQEHWSGMPCLPLENLPNPGIELSFLGLPARQGGFCSTQPSGSLVSLQSIYLPIYLYIVNIYYTLQYIIYMCVCTVYIHIYTLCVCIYIYIYIYIYKYTYIYIQIHIYGVRNICIIKVCM